MERITADSPGWLAERNQSSAGGRVESAFATIDTPAGGKKKWQMQGAAAETSEFQELVQRVAEVQAALAAVAGPGKARVKGKGDSKAGGKGKGKGHCIQHQFEKDGCKKEQYWHKHDQAQLGRFADVTDSGGRKACGYFAKLGSCFQRDCPLAHIEVDGARPGKKEDSPSVE